MISCLKVDCGTLRSPLLNGNLSLFPVQIITLWI